MKVKEIKSFHLPRVPFPHFKKLSHLSLSHLNSKAVAQEMAVLFFKKEPRVIQKCPGRKGSCLAHCWQHCVHSARGVQESLAVVHPSPLCSDTHFPAFAVCLLLYYRRLFLVCGIFRLLSGFKQQEKDGKMNKEIGQGTRLPSPYPPPTPSAPSFSP